MDSSTTNFSDILKALGSQIGSLTLIDPTDKSKYYEQSILHSQLRDKVQTIIKDLLMELNPKSSRRISKNKRKELSRLYVTAQLFQLDLSLFYIRWMAAVDWFGEIGFTASPLGDVNFSLTRLEKSLRQRKRHGIKLSSLAYHAIATDMRAWADKLSPEACTASGWLASAAAVSRRLRKGYHTYYTKESFARILEPLHLQEGARSIRRWERIFPLRVLVRFARAIWRRVYGLVAGYGLGAGNFVMTTLFLLLSFSAIYWAIDASAGCSQSSLNWITPLDYFMRSLGVFTTLGNVSGTLCSLDGDSTQRVASIESIFGYVMLSILISVFWMAFHESATGISNIRLRDREDSFSPVEHQRDTGSRA
jgi:hypothetical protein